MPLLMLDALAPCAAEVFGGGGFLLRNGSCAFHYCNNNDEVAIKLWGLNGQGGSCCYSVPSVCVIGIDGKSVKADGCSVIDWGGLLQVLLTPQQFCCASCAPPRLLGSCGFTYRGAAARAELYSDNGVRLAVISEKGALLGYFAVGQELMGSIARLDAGRKNLLAVRLMNDGEENPRSGQRLLLLDESLNEALDIRADNVELSEGIPVCTERLPSFCGYERRTRFKLEGGAWEALEPELGFFTHKRNEPVNDAQRALCLVQGIGAGMYGDVRQYVSNELAEAMPDDAPASFFGSFGAALLMPDALSEKPFGFAQNFYGLSADASNNGLTGNMQEQGVMRSEDSTFIVGTIGMRDKEELFSSGGIRMGCCIRPKRYEVHMLGGKAWDMTELNGEQTTVSDRANYPRI